MAKKLTDQQKTILQNATLKPMPAYKLAGYDLFLTVQARGSCLWSLVRHGYLEAHPDFYGGRMEQCYIITPAGAEAVGREDLFPLYDMYKTYRKIAWDGGYTALSYEDWYKVQPENTDTGRAAATESAAEDMGEMDNTPIELDYAKLWHDELDQRQWADETNAKLEQRLARAEAALRDIRDIAAPWKDKADRVGFQFSRIYTRADYGLKQSEDVVAGD